MAVVAATGTITTTAVAAGKCLQSPVHWGMASATASYDAPPFTTGPAPTFKHKFAIGIAGFVGGWIGDKVGGAIGDHLPLVPRPFGRILGGTLGGYLGARVFVGVTRRLLRDR